MKLRVQIVPPALGGATRNILGTDLSFTSPRFISGPAERRMDSIRWRMAAKPSLSSSSRVSYPVAPRSSAFITMHGMPLSIRVQRTPSISSAGLPVGSSAPQEEPAVSRQDRKSVVLGQSVSVRVDLGGRRII